eukprot:2293801-Karenia_brevis.AAC.1
MPNCARAGSAAVGKAAGSTSYEEGRVDSGVCRHRPWMVQIRVRWWTVRGLYSLCPLRRGVQIF